MYTIAIVNQKGGCGKTTVAINLSSVLSTKGKRVLLIDMDPQGHCALGLAVPEDQIELSVYHLLRNFDDPKKPVAVEDVVWNIANNFDLIPSTVELAGFEQEFSKVPNREKRLSKVIDTLKDMYDFCIIDCPPSVGLLTFNALISADGVIIPVETGFFSLQGLAKLLETIDLLKVQCGKEFVIKVLPNLYDVRTKHGREILAQMRRRFGEFMFKTQINFNTKLKESVTFGQAINEYDHTSMGYRDFQKLADEVIALFAESSAEGDELLAKAEQLSLRAEKLLDESEKVLGRESKMFTQASAEKKLEYIYGANAVEGGVRFLVKFPNASEVYVAGDFNNWTPGATKLERVENRKGDWELFLPLKPGKYQYRYIVDGLWCHDPYNHLFEPNPFGGLNSVVEIK